jgi:ABC-type transport system involved in cytochrome bd biosynthesis fused ATPase/permease subunit
LADWLAGLRLPSSGWVALNGLETSRASGLAVREHVSLVGRSDLFDGTVLENVIAGRSRVSTTEARAALDKVGLLEALRSWPKGLDTPITSTGWPLTQGHALQLLIARAIVGTPRLIVINESLESLDAPACAKCVEALTHPSTPWTLIALVERTAVALPAACGERRAFSPAEVES